MTEPVDKENQPRPKCGSSHPIPCPERKAEMLRGQFFYLWGIGWLWLRSKDVATPWERCPWCWGKLPTMEQAVLRLMLGKEWE